MQPKTVSCNHQKGTAFRIIINNKNLKIMTTLIDSLAHDVNLSPGTLHAGEDIEPGTLHAGEDIEPWTLHTK